MRIFFRTLVVTPLVAIVVIPLAMLVVARRTVMPTNVPSRPGPGEWVGALHVHTAASDGGGTVDDVVAAAKDEGLDFVVLTDHGARAVPDWTYEDGVLLIVGEETKTPYGHLLVLGHHRIGFRDELPGVHISDAVYRGPPAVAAWEGLRIAAHPTGRPPWTEWEPGQFDGMEIWNADTDHRNDGMGEWIKALALFPLRPEAAFFQLQDYPAQALSRWDEILKTRPHVFGVCGVDAHDRLPLPIHDLHVPSYRQSFRLAREHVLLARPPSGDPDRDGQLVIDALRAGHSYCGFDGLADTRGLEMTVRSDGVELGPGDGGRWSPDARLRVRLPPSGDSAVTRILRDGSEVGRVKGRKVDLPLPGPGVYRVESYLPRQGGRQWVWILTNPVNLRDAAGPSLRGPAPGARTSGTGRRSGTARAGGSSP